MASAALALTGTFAVYPPRAQAAKVRKKPPRQPLPPHRASTDGVDGSDAASTQDAPSASRPSSSGAVPSPAVPYPHGGLFCFYGRQTDPKTGDVRCLSPEELTPPRLVVVNTRPLAEKLGMLPKTSRLQMPNQRGTEPVDGTIPAEPEAPFDARVVRVSFENGAVGGALRSLRSRTDDMAKCVEDKGGLRSTSARLKLLFFVRGDRKASGMIVASARNIPVPVVRCIRKVIGKGTIGRPSTNPVGVKVLIELRAKD